MPPPTSVAVVHYNTNPLPAIVFGTNIHTTTTSVSTSTSINNNQDNVSAHINIGGMTIGANIQVDDNYNSEYIINTTTTTTTSNQNHVVEPTQNYIQEEVCLPMNNNTFLSAKKSIEEKSFSDTKLSQAKIITESNCLTSIQIKEVCMLFDFEDTKLQYAKFAFNFCYDKKNYWQINDVFNFDSTTEELNNFIKSR